MVLVKAMGKCDVCGKEFEVEFEQSVEVECKKCKRSFRICTFCQENGCPKCRGELESMMDKAEEEGLMF